MNTQVSADPRWGERATLAETETYQPVRLHYFQVIAFSSRGRGRFKVAAYVANSQIKL